MTGTEIVTRSTTEVVASPTVNLRGLVTAWLGSYASANTRTAYARDLGAWLAWCEGKAVDPMTAIRPHVDAWARHLEAEGLAPTTRSRRLAALSAFYRYAVGLGAVGANPASDIRRPKTGEGYVSLTPALDREEVSRLLAAAMSPRDRALVVLLVAQGLRVSEALALDLGSSETVRGHATVVVTGKGGRSDRIPLPPLVLDALTALAGDRSQGPVFLGEDGQRLSRYGVSRALARLGRRAGLSRTVTPHMLRATAITLALDAGASLRDVQDLARHADPRTTRRYDRNRGALDRHASYTLAALLSEPVSA
jgi:integrase/recombinase XerD